MNSVQSEAFKPRKNKFKKKKNDIRNEATHSENKVLEISNKLDSLELNTQQATQNIHKQVKKAVVSVKNFIETTENDEVTKLFRSMIGIDTNLNINSTSIRQFSCHKCYRSWWRRVRNNKQVSVCTRCKLKYDPVPFEKEFGTCEFNCPNCPGLFYKWCSKDGFIQCKNCNTECKPIKILINTLTKNMHLQSFSNASCSSSSSSNSSIVMDGASNTQINSHNSHNSSISDLNSRYSHSTKYYNYAISSKVRCQYCSDTNINLNSTIIFRPQHNSKKNLLQQPKYNNRVNSDLSFCSYCRKIPIFSDQHISTGSTLGSLSYQDDLDVRLLDDEIESLEPCIEQSSEENEEEEQQH